MVRAPCCEKMGLKKGPWSPEEDQILVSFIQQNGHGNWRALPKQAGLLRCGKSCRLRWINYLRPDIKRGNFTREEEETIIALHQMLGNRWSVIAARLPGRTDNEIKNVWHTHLKKKLKNHQLPNDDSPKFGKIRVSSPDPPESSSEMSSVTDDKKLTAVKKEEVDYSSEYFPPIDESFWSEESAANRTGTGGGDPATGNCENAPAGSMDFWYNLFITAGDMPDLPEF